MQIICQSERKYLAIVRQFFGVLTFLLLGFGSAAHAEEKKRVALVIGNSEYENVSNLTNPANDAGDISKTLKGIGFQVTSGLNLDYNQMRLAVRDFTDAATGADIILIYFAGHGIEIENTNYLIPVNATLKSDRDVDFEAIRLDSIVNAVADTGGLKIILVDACRNNPFLSQMARTSATRSVGLGLAAIEPGGVMVGYAARGGTIAMDGDGRNSPYAAALLEYMDEPGLELGKMFRKVRDKVYDLTDGYQEPFTYGSLPGEDIYFVPPVQTVALIAPVDQRRVVEVPVPPSQTELFDAAHAVNTVRGWALHANRFGIEVISDPNVATRMLEMVPAWISRKEGGGVLEEFLVPDSAARKDLQIALNVSGVDVGTPDGAFGLKTRTGIKTIQSSARLPETGYVDLGLLMQIGLNAWGDSKGDFISAPFAGRHHPEKLSMLGESPEIVRVLSCLGLTKSVYGVFNDHFYVAVQGSGSVATAQRTALGCGLELASITSAEENSFIVRMFSSDPSFFNVGYDSMTKISYKSGPYFGFRKDPNERNAKIGWRWYSGEPVKYTNWLPSKPNKNSGKGGTKQYAQFQYEKRGRVDLRDAVASQWFDGKGTGRSYIFEGELP